PPCEVVWDENRGTDPKLPRSETLLADLVLGLLCLIMVDQWSWLWSENMQKILHLLFGTLIQRWVEVQVDNLTCTQYWVQYLRLLQESIWPGGVLPGVPKPLRTEEQKAETKEQALKILMAILPGGASWEWPGGTVLKNYVSMEILNHPGSSSRNRRRRSILGGEVKHLQRKTRKSSCLLKNHHNRATSLALMMLPR
uniref:Sorting nexin C-terminal domain-containing protein n=1 Tax=Pseudonaja textilis TaxID=8673 RepID=A0A670YYJ6_PSETE